MQIQMIGFRIGNEFYAMNILSVLQIIPERKPIKVARAPAFVEGVIHLREEVIPLVDLRRRFGAGAPTARADSESSSESTSGRIVVARASDPPNVQIVGLMVDAATEVIRTDTASFLRAPDILLKSESAYSGDIYQDKRGQMYMVLNPKKILTPVERNALTRLDEVKETVSEENSAP